MHCPIVFGKEPNMSMPHFAKGQVVCNVVSGVDGWWCRRQVAGACRSFPPSLLHQLGAFMFRIQNPQGMGTTSEVGSGWGVPCSLVEAESTTIVSVATFLPTLFCRDISPRGVLPSFLRTLNSCSSTHLSSSRLYKFSHLLII